MFNVLEIGLLVQILVRTKQKWSDKWLASFAGVITSVEFLHIILEVFDKYISYIACQVIN